MKLDVWLLDESICHERPVWEKKYNVNLGPPISQHLALHPDVIREEIEKSWILDHEKAPATWKSWYDDDDHDDDDDDERNAELEEGEVEEAEYEGEGEVEEDEGNHNNHPNALGYHYDNSEGWLDLLGLHPDKDVIFLGYNFHNYAYSYCLKTSKLQYLGDYVLTRGEASFYWPKIRESYMYTPCWLDLLSDQNGSCIDLSYWTER
jgi:hypothetical protein